MNRSGSSSRRWTVRAFARARSVPLLAALMMASGCDLTGVEWGDAHVEVDPRVIRTIDYYASGPNLPVRPSEVTLERLDEIECLHTNTRGCWVRETIEATIENRGTRTLHLSWCNQPLQRYGLGDWHWVTRHPCSGGSVPLSIPPGERRVSPVSVQGAPAGEYRLRFSFLEGESELPADRSTSAPFHLEPLPDVRTFVCPTDSRAELAARIAREALEAAAEGRPTPDVRELLVLENRFPGFGGLFLANGVLTVWLTDLSQSEAISTELRAAWGRTPLIKKGDYSFSELVGWKVAISRSGGFPILGVGSLDADEERNRVSIGISNELIRADVACFVRGIGMPEGMANIHLGG